MKTGITFNIFLKDNRSKLTTRYPFLSQDQILSRLRQQWRKLNGSFATNNKHYDSLNRSHHQHKLSHPKKNTKLRRPHLDLDLDLDLDLRLNKNKRSHSHSGIYDFTDNCYQSSNCQDDETGRDSPYLFVNAYDASFQKTRKRSKVLRAKVNNEEKFKFKGKFEYHDYDFDEEKLQIEVTRQETTGYQSKGIKSNFALSHQMSSSPKSSGIQAKQNRRKQQLSHADTSRQMTKTRDYKQCQTKQSLLQKDGTPVRFSRRLLSKPMRGHVDGRCPGLAVNIFTLPKDDLEREINSDKPLHERRKAVHKARENQFKFHWTNTSTHQDVAKRDDSPAKTSPIITKLKLKVKQRQNDLKKLAKAKLLSDGNEVKKEKNRTTPQPRNNLSLRSRRGRKDVPETNVFLINGSKADTVGADKLDNCQTTPGADKDVLETHRSKQNEDEDLHAIDNMDHCICSDDEDGALLLRRYLQDENVKEDSSLPIVNVSPIQDDLVSKQTFTFTHSDFIKHPKTTPVKLNNIVSEQKKRTIFTKSDHSVKKENQKSDEQQFFKKKRIEKNKENIILTDVWTESQGPAYDSQLVDETYELPIKTLRQAAQKSMSVYGEMDKFDQDGTDNDCWNTDSEDHEEEDDAEECEFFCSQVASETNAVLIQALMKIKATGSSPENMLSADDTHTSPVMLSPESQSGRMQLSSRSLVTKRSTRTRMKKGDCDWSFLEDFKTLPGKDTDGEGSLFKEPLGVLFQDPTVDASADVNTPGKRRLVTSAVAATPSNFGSMFDAFNIFL